MENHILWNIKIMSRNVGVIKVKYFMPERLLYTLTLSNEFDVPSKKQTNK